MYFWFQFWTMRTGEGSPRIHRYFLYTATVMKETHNEIWLITWCPVPSFQFIYLDQSRVKTLVIYTAALLRKFCSKSIDVLPMLYMFVCYCDKSREIIDLSYFSRHPVLNKEVLHIFYKKLMKTQTSQWK